MPPKPLNPFHQPPSLAHFGAALRRHRQSLHLTLDNLADKTHISKPYLSNIETARAPGPPSEEKLKKIAHALHLPPTQLLAAADYLRTPPSIRKLLQSSPRRPDGTINLDSLVPPHIKNPKSKIKNEIPLRQIPLINRVAAGKPSEYTDLDYPAGVADQYIPAPDLPNLPLSSAFALKITGDSMAPDYREGDIIIVGPPGNGADPLDYSAINDGEDCVIRLADHQNFATTFKRIHFITDPATTHITHLRLTPLNPAHPEKTIPLDQITGLYPLLYRLVPPRKSKQ